MKYILSVQGPSGNWLYYTGNGGFNLDHNFAKKYDNEWEATQEGQNLCMKNKKFRDYDVEEYEAEHEDDSNLRNLREEYEDDNVEDIYDDLPEEDDRTYFYDYNPDDEED